jgi:hypothetical protein
MTLSFPNRSRSFDETRRAIRFIGYDGMLEVPFLVDSAALAIPDPAEHTEASYLVAFDLAREAIHVAARKAYSRARRKIYFLSVADLPTAS